MIKRLSFYDFDGTLIDSPEPDEGRVVWKKNTGEEYPHVGWWGRPESLDLNVFDIKSFPTIVDRLKRDVARSDTFVVVLTSRITKLKPQLEAILHKHGIEVDDMSLKDGRADKVERIKQYLSRFPEVNEINVYDDRQKEIDLFLSHKEDFDPDNIDFNIYQANNGSLKLIESKIISIIKDEIKKL